MDSDTEDNTNIEENIYNDTLHGGYDSMEEEYYNANMDGGYDSIEDEDDIGDINDKGMEGGALTKGNALKTNKEALLSKEYGTYLTLNEAGNYNVIINPRDLLFLAARIKPIHEQIALTGSQSQYTKSVYKGFFSIYYKTMYHLRMLMLEITTQNKSGIHASTTRVLDYRAKTGDKKIKAHFMNSQFVKSSKYQDSTYEKGFLFTSSGEQKAQYLTQLCSQAKSSPGQGVGGIRKRRRSLSTLYTKEGYSSVSDKIESKFVAGLETVFEKIYHIQGGLRTPAATNRLKCMLYYIRYHQVAFNYYFEQLLKIYKKILQGNVNYNVNYNIAIFADIRRRNERDAAIRLLGGNNDGNPYKLLIVKLIEMVNNPDEKINNDTLAEKLLSDDAESVFKGIMGEMNDKSTNTSLGNGEEVQNEYIYLFILFTYLTKRSFAKPNFFNIKTKLTEATTLKAKRENSGTLRSEVELSSGARLGILLSSIPFCMKILVNDILKYKGMIDTFKKNTGINHLANIVPDMYAIKNIFSKLTPTTTLSGSLKSEKDDRKQGVKIAEGIIAPYSKKDDSKPDNFKKNQYLNKILFASYVVDCLIMKLFDKYVFDNNKDDIINEYIKIYSRLLKTEFNKEVNVDDRLTDVNAMKKKLEQLLTGGYEIEGLSGDMVKNAYNYFTDTPPANRDTNIANCFNNLYKYSAELLLNTPIIIYRYEKLNSFKKTMRLFGNPRSKGIFTKLLRDHPNINKDIASMSRNAIKTLTNLLVGIELGIYDFEKNITFTKNSESVYSSLPLYFEKIFSKKVSDTNPPKYLLSTYIYDNAIDITKIPGLNDINSTETTLTSLEASTLSLEEIINLWYAEEYEAKRKTLKPLKGGADEESSNPIETGTDVNAEFAELATTFGVFSSKTEGEHRDNVQKGGAKKQRNVIGKIIETDAAATKAARKATKLHGFTKWGSKPYETLNNSGKQKYIMEYDKEIVAKKDKISKKYYGVDKYGSLNDEQKAEIDELVINIPGKFKSLQGLLVLGRNKLNKKAIDIEVAVRKANLPNGDEDLARMLLNEQHFKYMYDMANIHKAEDADDSEDNKAARSLLLKTMYYKIQFMKNRLKELMLDTPEITTESSFNSYRKLFKITLSKVMILVKMRQYVIDLKKIITTSKIITASKETNNTTTIGKYDEEYFNKFLANFALNNAKIAINLTGGADDKLYDFSIDKPIDVSLYDFKNLLKLVDPVFKMITEKEFKDLTVDQQLYSSEQFMKIKEVITKMEDTIKFKNDSSVEIQFPRIANTDANFSEVSKIENLNDANNPIKLALEHFWSADAAANPNAMKAANNDASNFSDDSDGNRKWHYALQSNIAKIRAYFLDNGNVFTEANTANIDPVLMYKINMRVLEEYNKAMKYCIDNFLKMVDDGNGFIDGAKDENVPTNFSDVLGGLVTILNMLARSDNNEGAIDNSTDIIEFKTDGVTAGEFQKTLCKQLSEYYLMVSVIRCIEYMFQVLTKCNEDLINTEFVINEEYADLRKNIKNGNNDVYQTAITDKLGTINNDANIAATAARGDVDNITGRGDDDVDKKDIMAIKEEIIGANNTDNTLKRVNIGNINDATDFGNGNTTVVGKQIADVENAKNVLKEAIANLFMEIVAKMATYDNIQDAKNYAITIKNILFNIDTVVSDAANTKAALVAGYGIYKGDNDDIGDVVKSYLNECLYVAVALAGVRMDGDDDAELFQGNADGKYDTVTIVHDNAPEAAADLSGFTLADMQNIVKYISFKIEKQIDTEVFTELGEEVKRIATGIVDASSINDNNIKGNINNEIINTVNVKSDSNIDAFNPIFGPIDNDDPKTDAEGVDFIDSIVNAILELPEIKSKVQQPKIQGMSNDLMKNVLQFTRYVYTNLENTEGQKMITLLTDDDNSPDFNIKDANVKPDDNIDSLFDKYRAAFSSYIPALITIDDATIYDRFNMVFMINYVASDVAGFVNSLNMSEEPIPVIHKYNLGGTTDTNKYPNIGLVIKMDNDNGNIVYYQYLPTEQTITVNNTADDISIVSKVELISAMEYAKNNHMLWVESGNNNNKSCWVNSAIAAVLADKRITYLPDTYDRDTGEFMFERGIQAAIITKLKKYANNDTEEIWTHDKYTELLSIINKNFTDYPDKKESETYFDYDKGKYDTIENIYTKQDINDDYGDAFAIMIMLLNVLQKGLTNGRKLEYRKIYGNSLTVDNLLPGATNKGYTEVRNPNSNYKLLSVIVPSSCSDSADNNNAHFSSYAKINIDDSSNSLNNYWVHTDLEYNRPNTSRIVSNDDFNRVLNCGDSNKYKIVYAIYIKNDAYEVMNQKAEDANGAAGNPFAYGGGDKFQSVPKTKKNGKKRATLTGKSKAVRNHSNYNNMYKGAKKSSMGNAKNNNKNNHRSPKTKKAGKRYTKTGKRA